MSAWTHAICDDCFAKKMREQGRPFKPIRIVEQYREDEKCCFCGSGTRSGIYYRDNPADVPLCAGTHD